MDGVHGVSVGGLEDHAADRGTARRVKAQDVMVRAGPPEAQHRPALSAGARFHTVS